MKLEAQFKRYQAKVDKALEHWIPAANIEPQRLHEAMRYSIFNGGKRFRPALVYAAGEALGVPSDRLDAPACAVECIHAYSLIHDDLPAMDNDDLRRGKPTCHKAFDEATAILAGDALQALAIHILSAGVDTAIPANQQLQMIDLLAVAAGSRGMAGGQAIDLQAIGQTLSEAELENMHIHKTGALIRASVKLGALCSHPIETAQLEQLDHFAKCIGLAFQIHDDVLDETCDTQTLGKAQGADRALNKPTYPSIIGLSQSIQLAQELCEEAIASLSTLGEAGETLRAIARFTIERRH